jgi:hypothetical protein
MAEKAQIASNLRGDSSFNGRLKNNDLCCRGVKLREKVIYTPYRPEWLKRGLLIFTK